MEGGAAAPCRCHRRASHVCARSFAGLFTARVCADHFSRVIVVEPDAFTFTEEAKSGAPFVSRTINDKTGPYKTLAHKRSRVYQYASTHGATGLLLVQRSVTDAMHAVVQVLLTRFLRAVFPDFDSRAKSSGIRYFSFPSSLPIVSELLPLLRSLG